MTDLDKKIQKVAPDLVQSVLDAQEKKNSDRVDMLITNAIKQLKMSRFKPDQTTCLSLTYLAKLNPKIFSQSTAIKDTLKSLLRRDNGPTNIKGKSDIVLPVLAANILIACCDSYEVRNIILNKIDQWVSGSNGQKSGEMIQHLLATLCIKCHGDQQTINTLIDMRQHWLQYMEDDSDLYGSIPADLCVSIRGLLHSETNCECLVGHLNFLIKHDTDIDGLGDDLGRFIKERPISLNSMLKEESGAQLNKIILKVFIKLFRHLKNDKISKPQTSSQQSNYNDSADNMSNSRQKRVTSVIAKHELKKEPPTDCMIGEVKKEIKSELKSNENKSTKLNSLINKNEPSKNESNPIRDSFNDKGSELPPIISYVYIKMLDNSQVIKLNKSTLEAVLYLISSVDITSKPEFDELLECWLVAGKSARQQRLVPIYEDFSLTRIYNIPDRLRQRLIQSKNDMLVELGLRDASVRQLVALLHQFGSTLTTIDKINKRIESIKDIELIKSEIKDLNYFNQLMDFYHDLGSVSSVKLQRRITSAAV